MTWWMNALSRMEPSSLTIVFTSVQVEKPWREGLSLSSSSLSAFTTNYNLFYYGKSANKFLCFQHLTNSSESSEALLEFLDLLQIAGIAIKLQPVYFFCYISIHRWFNYSFTLTESNRQSDCKIAALPLIIPLFCWFRSVKDKLRVYIKKTLYFYLASVFHQ
jgi:hypothetical protein